MLPARTSSKSTSTVIGVPAFVSIHWARDVLFSVSMDAENRASLAQSIEANAAMQVTVDVDLLEVRAGNLTFPCEMRAGARDSLLNGAWDPLDELLSARPEVEEVAKQLNYV